MEACSHFGLHNPIPTITRRLANYGNAEDVEKLIEKGFMNLRDEIE